MLKTNVRKYDNFKMYYWHGATLVGKYKMPQLKPTQSIPHDVIGYNERSGIKILRNIGLIFLLMMHCLKVFGTILK